jgi:hypothetical protein
VGISRCACSQQAVVAVLLWGSCTPLSSTDSHTAVQEAFSMPAAEARRIDHSVTRRSSARTGLSLSSHSITHALPAGEELPVAWKVLGPAMSCPAGNSPVSRHASTAHSSTDTQHARPACQHRAIVQHSSGSGEPAGLSPFARSSVPTGGQPLAFQHRPSRLRTTHTAEH